jgi:type VI secretion system secreted protein Hcp
MADAFLKIEGVTGEARHKEFAGQIELVSWSWGISTSASIGAGGGGSSARATIQELNVTKPVDSASADLLRYCATGVMIPRVTLTVVDPKAAGQAFLQLTLHDVIVSGVSVGDSSQNADGRVLENVSLLFRKVEYAYDPRTANGKLASAKRFSWDAALNAPIKEVTAPRQPPALSGVEPPASPIPAPGATPVLPIERPSPSESETAPIDERLRLTVFHPSRVSQERWEKLLVYIHAAQAETDVAADSHVRLGRTTQDSKQTAGATQPVTRGAEVVIVPELPGVQFNPPSQRVLWLEDWQCAEFRMRALPDRADSQQDLAVNGRVAFYVHTLLIGEVAIWGVLNAKGRVNRTADPLHAAAANPYASIFVSYSHRDATIVDRLQRAYKALGMTYMRDVESLRSGQEWNAALVRLIHEADIFQLYWSQAARDSHFVEREWREALLSSKPAFIRPVYWQRPVPDPPPELAKVHFAFIETV